MRASSFLHKATSSAVSIVTIASFLLQTTFSSYAQNITADPNAGSQNQPGVTSAQNGVPVVNIARPNASGLSHNKYLDFNVGQQGVVLNNSRTIGTSQLGGAMLNNPNLGSGPEASLILNEVTSANPSLLEGATEVFGGSAQYILANPNGITCNGCGFIGTPRASLTTGTPELDPATGALTGLSVDRGQISIEGLGLDASNTDFFDIISRGVAINGAIHGQDVSIITGRNHVDYANRVVRSVKADDGSAKPEFSVDSSALGGMYANRISLQGTEAGVGVRTPENLSVGSGGMVLTADGKLVMRKAKSQGAIRARSNSAGVEVQGNLHAGTTLNLEGATSLTVVEHATLGALKNVKLTAGTSLELKGDLIGAGMASDGSFTANEGDIELVSSGALSVAAGTALHAGNALTATSSGATDVSGTLTAGNQVKLTAGTLLGLNAGLIGAGATASGGFIAGQGNVELQSQDVMSVASGAQVYGGNSVTSSSIGRTDITGSVTAGQAVTLTAGAFMALGGSLIGAGVDVNGDFVVDEGDVAINSSGSLAVASNAQVHAGKSLTASSDADMVVSGTVTAGDKARLTAGTTLKVQSGLIGTGAGANGQFELGKGELELQSQGDLSVTAAGTVYSGNSISVASENGVEISGSLTAGQKVSVSAGSNLALNGELLGAGSNSVGDFVTDEGEVELNAAGGILVGSGTHVHAGNSLSASAGGNTEIAGKVSSDQSLSISTGTSLTTQANSLITTRSGDIDITAQNWTNNGGVGAGQDLRVNLSGNGTNNAVIAARRDLTLALPGNFTNLDTLLSARNMAIHGTTDADRAGTITNQVGHIEAIEGTLAIRALEFHNLGTAPTVSSSQTSSVSETFNHSSPSFIVNDYITTTITTESLDQAGAPAKLVAGGNLSIDANTITNRYSDITSGGDIAMTGQTLVNEGLEITKTTDTHHEWRIYKNGKTLREIRFIDQSSTSETIDSVPATISAAGSFTGTFSDRIDGKAIKQNAAVSGSATGGQIPGALEAQGTGASVNLSGSAPTFNIPTSSLNIFVPDPQAPYLFETRTEFVDLSRFYNSDRFLAALPQFAPEITQKRLGDAYIETKLIRDQLIKATGRSTLIGYNTDLETVERLYDNALAAQSSLQLTPGVGLNREQVAALTSNIVWLEETVVNGHKVLAPRLYMAPGNRSTIQLAGSRITGQDINLEAGTIENEGAITAVASLDISAEENLTNRGGTLSGDAVALDAGETLANESGTISGDTIAITAKNVRNETLSRRVKQNSIDFEVAQRRASISAGSSLSITAEEDIVSTGGDLASDGDAALSAGRDVRLEALKTEAGFNMDSDVGTTRVDATRHETGTLGAEGNLTIESGRDIAVIGTDIGAGENVNLDAGENVVISSVQNRLRSENTQAFKGESRHSIKDNSQTVGSSISAGNDLTINAGGDASVKASRVTSVGDLALNAEGDVNITGDKAVQTEHYKSSSKRILQRKSELSDGRDEVYSGSLLMSDGNVSITSGNDLTVKGSSIISEGDTTLEGDTVALAADTASSEFSQVKKKSGFFAERAKGGFGVTAGYRSQKDEFDAASTTAIVSSVGAGGSLTVNARNDIRSEGAVMAAENDITLRAANDIELLSTYDLAMQSQRHEKKQIGVTISVFENVSGPVKTLIDTPRAALSGKGNAGFKALSGVSAGLRALDAANSLNGMFGKHTETDKNGKEKEVWNGGTIAGVRVGVGVSSEKSRDSQQSSIAQVSNLSAGNNLVLDAGRDIVSEGTQIDVGNDTTITAGRDIELKSAKNTTSMDGSNSSRSAGVGLTVGVGLREGPDISVDASVSAQNGEYAHRETTNTNTDIFVGGRATVTAGRDLALKGASIDAGSADVEVGRDLTVESQLDTAKGSNSSKGVNAGINYSFVSQTGGVNVGANMAKGWQSRAWVGNPSGILTDDELDITVGNKTSLTGGVLASRSDELTLETETLETKDLELHDKNRQVSGSVSVNVGRSAKGEFTPGASVEGSYSNYEKEGIAHATIGEGTIVVRDGDADGVSATRLRAEADAAEAAGDADTAASLRAMADAEEAEDKAASETQLANLNRDPDNVVEVTKVTDEGFALYVSDTSVRELGKVLSALGDAIKDLNISPEQKALLAKIAACTSRQGYNQYNPLNWLITPAYASDCSDVSIEEMMEGVEKETLEELIVVCERLDPGKAAYAKALLAAKLYEELPAQEKLKLKYLSSWDYGTLNKLSADTIRLFYLASEATQCREAGCSETSYLVMTKLAESFGGHLSNVATFFDRPPPAETPLGFSTEGMSWSEVITIIQAEELVVKLGGFGAGVAVSRAVSLISSRVGPRIAARFRQFFQNPNSRGCSFQADTLVLTESGLLPISDVDTSMSVWSRNPANGDMGWQRVQAQYSNPYDEAVSVAIRDLETGTEQTIVSNRIHPYFVQTARHVANSSEGHFYNGPLENGYWIDAGNLSAGDRLLNDDGSWAEVIGIEIEAKPLTAYNLTVAAFHSYFVAGNESAAPVWVHNDCFTSTTTERMNARVNIADDGSATVNFTERRATSLSTQDINALKTELREQGVQNVTINSGQIVEPTGRLQRILQHKADTGGTWNGFNVWPTGNPSNPFVLTGSL